MRSPPGRRTDERLCPQVFVLRIVWRIHQHRRLPALAEYLDRDPRSDFGKFRLYVADREALPEHVPVEPGRRPADHPVLRVEQRLVAERVRVGDAVHFERDEPVWDPGSELALE